MRKEKLAMLKFKKFKKMFVPGGLLVPKRILKRETFCASPIFSAPKELWLDGYCTPVENQGALPYCAAYSASSFAENILWRKNHYPQQIDPVPLYQYAKTIDGSPNTPGTYLECTLEALLKFGYFDKNTCKVRSFGGKQFGNPNPIRDVRFAIHEFGCCLAGFNITTEWYNPEKVVTKDLGEHHLIKGGKKYTSEGGHAVLIVGYNLDKFLILNSWGEPYADKGFVYITNDEFERSFISGAVLVGAV